MLASLDDILLSQARILQQLQVAGRVADLARLHKTCTSPSRPCTSWTSLRVSMPSSKTRPMAMVCVWKMTVACVK